MSLCACFPKFSGPGAHGVASAILQYFTLLTGTYDPHFNNNYDNNNNHVVIILLLLITKVIQMTILVMEDLDSLSVS